jgi:23S rRNA pseudouridine955/2504/2580 synthase
MATPGASSVDALLEIAVAAARAGGAVLVEGLARPAEVHLKSERTSIVTWADVTAQDKIVDIVTDYRVLKEFPDRSLLEVQLITGRTHQIRAQFAHIGHPILGDPKYGDRAWNKANRATSQALISYKIVFLFATDAGIFKDLNGKSIELAVPKNFTHMTE